MRGVAAGFAARTRAPDSKGRIPLHAYPPQIERLLADLNEPQRQAVLHRDGPLLVLAGPGSGKTRVITRRAACLVHQGVSPRQVLAITFTNKAADEMKRRIEELGIGRGMWVCTFHALGVRLLREFGPLARVQPGFSIYDEADQVRLIKAAMEVSKVSAEFLKPDLIQARISQAKNALRTPARFAASAEYHDDKAIARVYETYERLLERNNAVDFDDLLMRVAIVLRDHPDVTAQLNERFRYVLVDEYQDTNHAQYLIANDLARHHHNICATGDPDQSIYAWRGADLNNILSFERDHRDAVVVRLEENYRSTGHILRVASELISRNRRRKHKALWTQNGAGAPVRVLRFAEGRDEAEYVAETIQRQQRAGQTWSDFAICYRTNALSRGLEESLRHRGIPYKIARGVEFYNRREIRDVLAYLHVLANPSDEGALLRIINTPPRGIGKTTLDCLALEAERSGRPLLEVVRGCAVLDLPRGAAPKLQRFLELLAQLSELAELPPSELISRVIAASGLERALQEEDATEGEDRLANVYELISAAARYEGEAEAPSLTEFLQRVSLTSDQDAVDEHAGVVLLMTLHAAKGLEFPVVFLVGLEQGLLPHERALRGDGDVEEERRLCFVGITRAKQELFLCHARQRIIRGMLMPSIASQFLRELPEEATQRESFDPEEGDGPADFEPIHDDLPPEENARRLGRGRFHGGPDRARLAGRLQRYREGGAARSDFAPRGAPPNRWPARTGSSGARPGSAESDDQPRVNAPASSPYADWKAGTLVQHERYGVGQVQWLQPGAGQTRACVKFAGYGEKTFILELAPIRKLERGG